MEMVGFEAISCSSNNKRKKGGAFHWLRCDAHLVNYFGRRVGSQPGKKGSQQLGIKEVASTSIWETYYRMGSIGDNSQLNSDGTQGTYENFFQSVVSCIVIPSKKMEHPKKLLPSHLDHLHMDRYVPLILCFQLKNTKDDTYRQFVDRVKHALAEVLTIYYPTAGRVLKTEDPDHPRQWLLNDSGVPFTEAVLDVDMGSMVNPEDYQPTAFLSGFEPAGLDAFKQTQSYPEGGIPSAIIQITRFRCGGVIMAFSWHHMLVDMTGAVQFLTAWSDIARTGATTLVPDHNRSILTHPPKVTIENPPMITPMEAAQIQEILKAKYKTRTLHVRREAIAKLKAEAVKEYPEVSTLDCLCAHLWRCLAAVNVSCGVTNTTAFTTAVEGRARMGVSSTYFGNVVMSAPVMGIPAVDITSQPLGYAASLIRKAVSNIKKESYWGIIEMMDLRNPWKTSINRTDYQLGVASWVRFGLNDLDFGFGRPTYMGVNLPPQNCRKGQCILIPSARVEGDFFVMLFQVPHIIEALWADPEFISVS